jgi:cytochrome P450
MRRTALEDTVLEGQEIKQGQKLLMYYPSANRDADVFERPDEFIVDRRDNNHLAFGVGEHFCIGTHLAKLETRVLFDGLLDRLHDVEIAGPVTYLRSNLIDGVKHLPIKFTGAG